MWRTNESVHNEKRNIYSTGIYPILNYYKQYNNHFSTRYFLKIPMIPV